MNKEFLQGREVIIEFHPVGHVMKVTAMDVQSLTEVVIQGPVNAPQSTLKTNAIKRLEYVMKKKGLI
jgi:hypothetical protein